MKIIELEAKTGLDRATIRFYEREGLIQPVRQENGYRDYSDEDRNHLMKIKLLRQVGMSLDRIRNIQQGSEDFSAALTDQIKKIDWKITAAQQAKVVCQDMLNDRVSYDTLKTEIYFAKLSEKPSAQEQTLPKTYHEPAAKEPYHPVRRFVARMLDYLIIRCLLLFLLIVVLRIRPFSDFLSNLINYGTPFLAIPILAAFLSCSGTTPGKWLMGLGVEHSNGGRLSFADAADRELSALRSGYGFGIPIWSLIRLYKSYQYHGFRQSMDWDYRSEYIYHPWKLRRKIAFFAAFILAISSLSLCIADLLKPKYRGELTISEFSSNYNDYLEMVADEPSANAYLKEDGTWAEASETNGVVIEIGSETEVKDFVYETEGEKITGLKYHQTWTDIVLVDPLGTRTQLAALTLLMSQDGSNIRDFYDLATEWGGKSHTKADSITWRNIQISWTIKTVNCMYVESYSAYITDDPEKESSIELYYEIIIH